MNPISVLLVDDNPTFLQEHDDVVVASTAGGGRGPSPTSKDSTSDTVMYNVMVTIDHVLTFDRYA